MVIDFRAHGTDQLRNSCKLQIHILSLINPINQDLTIGNRTSAYTKAVAKKLSDIVGNIMASNVLTGSLWWVANYFINWTHPWITSKQSKQWKLNKMQILLNDITEYILQLLFLWYCLKVINGNSIELAYTHSNPVWWCQPMGSNNPNVPVLVILCVMLMVKSRSLYTAKCVTWSVIDSTSAFDFPKFLVCHLMIDRLVTSLV